MRSHVRRYPTPSRTYHFDATNGSDTNTGQTDKPRKTIGHLNTLNFNPGDRILFSASTTWQPTTSLLHDAAVRCTSSGKPGRPIYYGRYGTGSDPVFKQLVLYTDFSLFDSPTYRRSTGGVEIFAVFENDVRLKLVADIATVKTTAASWFYDGTSFVYVHTSTGADPNGLSVGYPAGAGFDSGFDIRGKNWITVDHINVTHAKSHCFDTSTVAGTYGANFINCSASWSTGRGFRLCENASGDISYCRVANCTTHDTAAEGIWANGNGTIVEDNEIYDTKKDFVSKNIGNGNDAAGIIAGVFSKGVIIRRNYIHDGYDNGLLWLEYESIYGETARPTNCIIENNHIYSNVSGSALVSVFQGDNTNIVRNNVIENTSSTTAANLVIINNGGAPKLYNNTMIQTKSSNWTVDITGAGTNPEVKNNIIRNIGGNNLINFENGTLVAGANLYSGGSAGTGFNAQVSGVTKTFSTWKTALSETDALNASPVFTNESGRDYHLQVSSPCIGAGQTGLVVEDYDRVLRGAATDIGAYEYV